MELNEYQSSILRTLPPDLTKREIVNLGALGLGGEGGEVIDLVKKYMFHGQPLDRDKLRKELGDTLWYVSCLALGADLTLDEVAQANIEKLKARFPDGFTPEASVRRADEHRGESV